MFIQATAALTHTLQRLVRNAFCKLTTSSALRHRFSMSIGYTLTFQFGLAFRHTLRSVQSSSSSCTPGSATSSV